MKGFTTTFSPGGELFPANRTRPARHTRQAAHARDFRRESWHFQFLRPRPMYKNIKLLVDMCHYILIRVINILAGVVGNFICGILIGSIRADPRRWFRAPHRPTTSPFMEAAYHETLAARTRPARLRRGPAGPGGGSRRR